MFMIKGSIISQRMYEGMIVVLVTDIINGELLWRARRSGFLPIECKFNRFIDMDSFCVHVKKHMTIDGAYCI